MDVFSERIKKLREDRGTMQSDVVDHLNISRSSYSNYENGHTPPVDVVISLAAYYGVTTDYLLGRTNDKRPPTGTLEGMLSKLSQSAGDKAISASDISALVDALQAYYHARCPVGDTPVSTVKEFLQAIPDLLYAIVKDDTPGVLANVNKAMLVSLSINKILADYVASPRREP